jgi:hypothetical protein
MSPITVKDLIKKNRLKIRFIRTDDTITSRLIQPLNNALFKRNFSIESDVVIRYGVNGLDTLFETPNASLSK